MYSYVTLAQRIPADHPARATREIVDRALARMDAELDQLYSTTGRLSIAPERLLRASLLMVLYSIRSERQLMEQMNYNQLYGWFVGLEMDDPVWDVTVFTKNRERLIGGAASQRLLRGLKRVDWFYRLAIAAYNLVRMRRLIPIQATAC